MSQEHKHIVAANKIETLHTFKGCTVKGALVYDGCYILIFECGYGLVYRGNGAFWVAPKEEIEQMASNLKKSLEMAGI